MGKIKMLEFISLQFGDSIKLQNRIFIILLRIIFDGIKIEDLTVKKITLAECMGIKFGANSQKAGISHQRYCLFEE